jgi:YYY domain-containing protein
VLYLPFWLAFSPPTKGFGVVREQEATSRFLRDYALIYGLPLWIALALFAGRFRLAFRHVAWGSSVLLVVVVFLAAQRLAGQALALLLTSVAVFATFASGRLSEAYRMLWLLTAVAIGLIAAAEVVYVRDAFDGTASYRFNTVFKTGYQAWILLAVVAGVSVFWSTRWVGRTTLRRAWLVGAGVLVVLSLAYPVAGSYSRTSGFSASPTLDGMLWLERAAPDDAAAITWLQGVEGSPTLLETVGRDFDPEGRARVSTFTGMPAVMGWAGHEVQWGHDPGTRLADVRTIYSTPTPHVARRLLERYGVDYVFVGELERRDYPTAGLAKFRELGTVVFRSGRTVVYEMSTGRGTPEAVGRIR